MIWKADFAVWKYGRRLSSRWQPLIQRPHRLIGTPRTVGSACKDELTLETEERLLERYLSVAKGPIWLYARRHPEPPPNLPLAFGLS
jgi:hypothetical protein